MKTSYQKQQWRDSDKWIRVPDEQLTHPAHKRDFFAALGIGLFGGVGVTLILIAIGYNVAMKVFNIYVNLFHR